MGIDKVWVFVVVKKFNVLFMFMNDFVDWVIGLKDIVVDVIVVFCWDDIFGCKWVLKMVEVYESVICWIEVVIGVWLVEEVMVKECVEFICVVIVFDCVC